MSTDTNTNSLFSKVFKRSPDADYLEGAAPWRIGLSMAATWSWGAAIAVAISVLHTMGIAPFVVWVTFNCLSIGLFGLYYRYIPNVSRWKTLLPMLLMWGFIGYFAIVMNLNTILAVLGGNMDIPATGFMTETYALYTTIAIGLAITWIIGVYGLRGSVLTDVGQLSLQFVGAIGILVVGLANGYSPSFEMGLDQQSFMITASMGFIFGATASGMQWQRMETLPDRDDQFKASLWGSAIFTAFMLVVAPAAFVFTGDVWQSAFLVIGALAVATSTADSGSALLQYISQRFYLPASGGTILTLAAVLSFHLLADMGLTGIWSFYASVRWQVILALIVGTLIYNVVGVPDSVKAFARKVRFVLDDQVLSDEKVQKYYADD
ncbi:hypothetical protein [Natrinema salsiterrestre]|uniref:Uncharacterized protein n=1 Tax=Natrinema salsiterrestre TaxID=2950540 RepID=A0A9Q4KY34_9EURY|nr:hypothetical protein [Natrinema salsiterrestre]MDF9745868.1 hypothetical protein [Natrinema salsiterrestre]